MDDGGMGGMEWMEWSWLDGQSNAMLGEEGKEKNPLNSTLCSWLNLKEERKESASLRERTRQNCRQRPAAKLIGPNYNGNPQPIKLSMTMLKISIAQQQQQQQQQGHTQH